MEEQLEYFFEESITKVLQKYSELEYAEVYYFLKDFLDEMPTKIKEETKIKRLKKIVEKEFEMQLDEQLEASESRVYDFSQIPKYLFSWKIKSKEAIIKIKNLKKEIWWTKLFEQANVNVYNGEKIAIVWKNGVGKTTLLKMIIKKEEIDDGIIEIASWLKIWYLSQDLFMENKNKTLKETMFSTFPEITENIKILEKLKKENKNHKKQQEIIEFLKENDGFRKYDLQLDILKYFWFKKEQLDLKIWQLSGWEQTKVQIAKFLIQQVDILILDEPTNHLDIEWIIFLEEFCQMWEKTILLISHDVKFINNTSNKIFEIYGKKINVYNWNYDYYLKQKDKNYEIQLKKYNQQQKELQQQQDYINRFRAKASKASSVQSRIKMLEKMEIIEKPENDLNIRPIKFKLEKHLPETICKMQNLLIWYDNKELIVLPEKLKVSKKDKIWIIWKNGVGKTTLLKTILWELKPLSWILELTKWLKIGSYQQIMKELDQENTILQELLNFHKSEKEIRTMLGRFLLVWDKVLQKISTLSGGEKAKVGLVKMLLEKPDILIMDEPTNHLDIYAKEVVKKLLQWFDGVSIVVSHDRDLLENTSNMIWLVKDNKLEVFYNIEKSYKNLLN